MTFGKTTLEQTRSKAIALRLVLLAVAFVLWLTPTRVFADTTPTDSQESHNSSRRAARWDMLIRSGPTKPHQESHPSHARGGAERRARVREGRSSRSPRSGRASCGGGLTQNRKTEQQSTNDPHYTYGAKTYQYDATNRLTKVSWSDTYNPNPGVPESAVTTSYEIEYGYDNAGNTTSRTRKVDEVEQEALSLSYDGRNRLVRVGDGSPEDLGQFDYNYAGVRVRHHFDSRGDLHYYNDGRHVVEERDAADPATIRARYHYGAHVVAIDRIDSVASESAFYHPDAQGTPTHLTATADGSATMYSGLDVWGAPFDKDNLIPSSGQSSAANHNRKLFTGHDYDDKTGLHYAQQRYIDSEAGRFLTQDRFLGYTGSPQSLHRYTYAHNNPAAYVDPDGRAICGGVCIGIAAGAAFVATLLASGEAGAPTNEDAASGRVFERKSHLEAGATGVVTGAAFALPGMFASGLGLSGWGAVAFEGSVGAVYDRAAQDVLNDEHTSLAGYGKAAVLGGAFGLGAFGVGKGIGFGLSRLDGATGASKQLARMSAALSRAGRTARVYGGGFASGVREATRLGNLPRLGAGSLGMGSHLGAAVDDIIRAGHGRGVAMVRAARRAQFGTDLPGDVPDFLLRHLRKLPAGSYRVLRRIETRGTGFAQDVALEIEVVSELSGLRGFGGAARQAGGYVSFGALPASRRGIRNAFALPTFMRPGQSGVRNTLSHVTDVKLRPGSRFLFGEVAPQAARSGRVYRGGGTQGLLQRGGPGAEFTNPRKLTPAELRRLSRAQ